jgi:cyanophycinase
MIRAGRALLTCGVVSLFVPDPLIGQSHGPRRGTLVISGGSETSTEIYERFIELAGGRDTLIVVVPTSGSDASFDDSCACLTWLRKAGARNLRLLHTRDRVIANSASFVAPLRAAGGVWFAEGNSWRHADAYLGTKVHEELFALLDRGGVVGGGSAGARIQSDYLPLRSPEPAQRAIPRERWRQGFRLLRNVIIDVHVLARNRQFDLIGMVTSHPDMLGIGIDENTAIVVQGDSAEVIGGSYVLIYDNRSQVLADTLEAQHAVGGLFYLLRRGDTYDLRTRQALRAGRRPVERVGPRRWPQIRERP